MMGKKPGELYALARESEGSRPPAATATRPARPGASSGPLSTAADHPLGFKGFGIIGLTVGELERFLEESGFGS